MVSISRRLELAQKVTELLQREGYDCQSFLECLPLADHNLQLQEILILYENPYQPKSSADPYVFKDYHAAFWNLLETYFKDLSPFPVPNKAILVVDRGLELKQSLNWPEIESIRIHSLPEGGSIGGICFGKDFDLLDHIFSGSPDPSGFNLGSSSSEPVPISTLRAQIEPQLRAELQLILGFALDFRTRAYTFILEAPDWILPPKPRRRSYLSVPQLLAASFGAPTPSRQLRCSAPVAVSYHFDHS